MKVKLDIKKMILIIIISIIMACNVYFDNRLLISSFEQGVYAVLKMEGSSSSSLIPAIIYIAVCFVIICPILLLPVIDFGKKLVISIKNKIIQLYPIRNIKIYSMFLIFASIIFFLYVIEFFPFVKNVILSDTEIFEDYYVDGSKVEFTFPKEKRNLIYIFLESMESTNVSVENGGLFEETVIPNLERLAIENINFSNNDKIGGASHIDSCSWTAAAMIAHTSGVPLRVSLNDFDVNSTRFNNVTSIGDILSDNGYNNYLLLGSDASFGGRRAYFANHDYLIKDYYTAIDDGIIGEDYYEWWGYEDSKLFTYAKDILSDISQDDKPFNFTMLTANTHFKDGYLEDTCDSKFDDPYSNSFYCSDNMINEFIEWLKEQDFYDNTTIVIVGDHLTMQKDYYDNNKGYERSIYNVFINANVVGDYNNKNRGFTVMDMFPTTIASLGVDIEGDRIGLGTNLFSDKETIPEIVGMDMFKEELSKGSNYYYNYIRK